MNSYWLIGIYLLIITIIFGIARFFKTYKIDAKPLTQQTLFWLAILIPIVSFIYFGLFAWWGKTPVFSAHGFERFIKISTLPLGLLSLAIPFTAVINNIHRTVQTNEQIEQTKQKNKNDIHFSHQKFAIDFFSVYIQKKIKPLSFYCSIETDYDVENTCAKMDDIEIKVLLPFVLYEKMFPQSSHGDITADASFMNDITEIWRKISHNITMESNTKSKFEKAQYLIDINKNIITLINLLELTDIFIHISSFIPVHNVTDGNNNISNYNFNYNFLSYHNYENSLKLLYNFTVQLFSITNLTIKNELMDSLFYPNLDSKNEEQKDRACGFYDLFFQSAPLKRKNIHPNYEISPNR
ncbi:hypothetical protein AAA733_002267 [Providencia rettgeri]